ncbi:FKBP-type peptidyl-prolyl cis-trans isomerase [Arthrobacter sp.]|uniref:FKBP-type peptidyl-prolyl cis-trans isomerase n=1 Tax=Arthrobacter sp. TaxID=1667 RepID=UPI003A93A3B6
MRKLLALVLGVALLALTACGSGTPKSVGAVEPLSSIKVTPGADDNTAPKVEFDTPMKATAPGAKVIEEGDGATIKAGQDVSYKMSGYNTQDGKEIGNTFTDAPMTLSVEDALKEQDAEIYNVLVGTKVGSWVAYVRPDDTAEATEGESKSAEPAEAKQVLILKVLDAKDKKITFKKEEGDAKKGTEASATLGDDGKATINIPAGNEPPADLKVTTLKEGDGAKVKKSDTVTVNYAGATWSDGRQFDSSYDRGEPATFGLNQVIKGWTQGLEGVKVGSTVLLTIPGKLAYDGSAGKPQGTLVFIVEVTKADAAAK